MMLAFCPPCLELAWAGFLGASLGSFALLCADRLPQGLSVLAPPSRCPACGRALKPWQLVPVLSFLLLRGRCRFCQTPIAFACFFLELLPGLAFLALDAGTDSIRVFAAHALLFFLLALLSALDERTGFLPDRLIAAACLVWGILGFETFSQALEGMASGLAAAAYLLLLRRIATRRLKREAVGLGDVKLVFLLGLAAGVHVFLALLLAGIAELARILAEKILGHKALKERPFGPALAFGCVLTLLLRLHFPSLF